MVGSQRTGNLQSVKCIPLTSSFDELQEEVLRAHTPNMLLSRSRRRGGVGKSRGALAYAGNRTWGGASDKGKPAGGPMAEWVGSRAGGRAAAGDEALLIYRGVTEDGKRFPSARKSSFPAGKSSLPGGKRSLPGGKWSLPGGKWSLPGGKRSLPGGKWSLPGRKSRLPGGKWRLPGGKSSLPGGFEGVPAGKWVRSGSLRGVPGGSRPSSGGWRQFPGGGGPAAGGREALARWHGRRFGRFASRGSDAAAQSERINP
jgi:hypothetical protein